MPAGDAGQICYPTGKATPAEESRAMIISFKHQTRTEPTTSTTNRTMAGCPKKHPTLPTHRLPKAFKRSSIICTSLVTPTEDSMSSQSNESKTPGNCRKTLPANQPARLTDERSGRRKENASASASPDQAEFTLHEVSPLLI